MGLRGRRERNIHQLLPVRARTKDQTHNLFSAQSEMALQPIGTPGPGCSVEFCFFNTVVFPRAVEVPGPLEEPSVETQRTIPLQSHWVPLEGGIQVVSSPGTLA